MHAYFQSFEDTADRAAGEFRLKKLCSELARQNLDGFIVPRADRYQNEYVPPSDERLRWLTGFTGSSGTAVVLIDRAALFVDGRYTLQARDEADTSAFAIVHVADTSIEKWIEANLKEGQKLGYDPWLHTIDGAERLAKACAKSGAVLIATESNPIDSIWDDKPAAPTGAVSLHDLKYAGETAAQKIVRVQQEIAQANSDALIVSDPHAVCWLFNIRGHDVAHTPLALALAIVPKDGQPSLFIDGRKLTNSVRSALEDNATISEPDDFSRVLSNLGSKKYKILVDPSLASDAIQHALMAGGGSISRRPDPIAQMKAIKNTAEIAGAHAAHLRDGVAVTRFLAWFSQEAPSGRLTEIDAVKALENFRRDSGALKDISFPTIAGAGPNGAIVHYRVTSRTNRKINPGELFLIDSGAQYEDGTTDITRTISVGQPTNEMRDRFTRVLKGHIAIARAVFPEGTTGAQLDSFARQYLWSAGLDFDHGTGHGVGSYLSVHEGPARISKMGHPALKRGMILSNEPGYYKANAYGIRIENLVLVTEARPVDGAERPLNSFETLTLAPIDRQLILLNLMTKDELTWLDGYHACVRHAISPLVDETTRKWLTQATAPLGT